MIERPEIVEDAHLTFLDDLRGSGSVNMFAAPMHVQEIFGVNRRDSQTITKYWMDSFSERAGQNAASSS